MNNYIKIAIALQSPEQAGILVAQLNESGYEGFEEDENKLGIYHLYAFIPEEKYNGQELSEILSTHALSFSKQIIEHKNWNEEWEKNFQPVLIGDFCAIRASFHEPVTGVKNEIIITPKMSFGTGHHPTTCLMIEAMEKIDFRGKSVFDFGTGTGVLAILAEKLGASDITAVDIDNWSIENIKENIAENQCSVISVKKADGIHSTKKFDIILANINKNVILPNLGSLRQQLAIGGVLLVSGLLELDFEDIRREAVRNHFSIARQLSKENWLCLQLHKTNP